MTININAITESDIATAIAMDDIDDACSYLQDIAGITDGGIAADCFSDVNFDWARDVTKRERMTRDWLATERAFA